MHHLLQQSHRWVVGDLLLDATQRLDFNLTHAFAREPDFVSDLFERERFLTFESVAEPNHLRVALVDLFEDAQHHRELFAVGDARFGTSVAIVLEQLMQFRAFAAVAGGRLTGRVVGLHRAAHDGQFAQGDAHFIGEFLQRWLSSQHDFQSTRRFFAARDEVDHVGGDVDRLHRVDERALDRLLDPPRGVG